MTANINPAQIPLPPSIRSSSSASIKERAHMAETMWKTAREAPFDAASMTSSHATSGVLAHEPMAAMPQKPIHQMTAEHFGEQVAAVAKQTKLARNVMPMLVRGGLMAGVGMLVFGHLAPLAIIATIVGAVVGGYVIAKFLQLRQAKQFAAMGENNPLLILRNNVPHDANQADLDKLNGILDFVERGNVFEEGVVKSFREPYRAIKNRIATMLKPPQLPESQKADTLDDAASSKSALSDAEKYKQDVLREAKA